MKNGHRFIEWYKSGKPTFYELYDYNNDPHEFKNLAVTNFNVFSESEEGVKDFKNLYWYDSIELTEEIGQGQRCRVEITEGKKTIYVVQRIGKQRSDIVSAKIILKPTITISDDKKELKVDAEATEPLNTEERITPFLALTNLFSSYEKANLLSIVKSQSVAD